MEAIASASLVEALIYAFIAVNLLFAVTSVVWAGRRRRPAERVR